MGKNKKEGFPPGWFWDPGEALLVGLIGFGLSYLILVAHTFAHPIHWAWAGVGAVLSYSWGLLLIMVRRWRFRRQWGAPKQDRERP